VPILLIHPDQSAGRELLRALLGDAIEQMRTAGALQVALITESDHMFTPLAAQRDLVETVGRWARAGIVALPSALPAGQSW
jgi:hypothetical protein